MTDHEYMDRLLQKIMAYAFFNGRIEGLTNSSFSSVWEIKNGIANILDELKEELDEIGEKNDN